jgi:hypothetical protein
MSIKLSSGNMKIYASGSIVPAGDKALEIIFDETNPPLRFQFDFADDNGETERAQLRKSPEGAIKITFFNFNKRVDNANPNPLLLGRLNGQNLYFSYRINALANQKILNYTWYLGDPDNEN